MLQTRKRLSDLATRASSLSKVIFEGGKNGRVGGWKIGDWSFRQSLVRTISELALFSDALVWLCFFDFRYSVRFSDDEAVVPGTRQFLALKTFNQTLQTVLQLVS